MDKIFENGEEANAIKLYELADEFTKEVKLENSKLGKTLGEDFRQDLVTQVCLNMKKFDATKGTKQDYVRIIFNMVQSAYQMPYEKIEHAAPYYEAPMRNFINLPYNNFNTVARIKGLSPFAYGEYLHIEDEQIRTLANVPANAVSIVKNSDAQKLSTIKVAGTPMQKN